MPPSPSMYVIPLRVEAVLRKAGSYDMSPSRRRSVAWIVPSVIEISTSSPERLSRIVSVSSATRGTLAPSSSIASVNPPIVWAPSQERVASATITRYREWRNETRSLELADYQDLWRWSVDEL